MLRTILIAMTCMSLVAAGCQVDTRPATVVEAGAPERLALRTAPWRGEFRLYSIPPHPGNALESAGTPITSIHLPKGEALGFRKRQDGSIVAVAGAQETPVATGKYAWVMQADAGQTDPVKTTILVVVIVIVAAVGIAIAVIASNFNHSRTRELMFPLFR